MRYNFSKLYQHSVSERLALLEANEIIDHETFTRLSNGHNSLNVKQADKMVENVIGVFGLPIGLGTNFLINGKEYVVPMVTEEPSIIAGVSCAAKTIRESGGFTSQSSETLLIGQIVISDVLNHYEAERTILERKQEILNTANSFHPKMVARGGGVTDIEVHHQVLSDKSRLVVIHLLIDTRDAMGANFVNTVCEEIAPMIKKIIGGNILMRIVSNLHNRSIVKTQATIRPELLTKKDFNGKEVCDRIVMASNFSVSDPYRAATHNKGIMNGIDAVAVATGNDYRAIEAAGHAYAASGSKYTPLSLWSINDDGNLIGKLTIPLKVATVGSCLQFNPAVKDMLKILNVKSAQELAQVMGAVGLAQNFAILRVLVTRGVQEGHMGLNARKEIA